ncbi:MAG: phosphatase PAP2 family protein [Pirellulaceae bacterium]
MLVAKSDTVVTSTLGWQPDRTVLLAACATGLAPLALLIDVPISAYCAVEGVPGELKRVLEWSEVLAHGSGVAILAVVLFVLDTANRRYIPRLLIGAYGAGLAADLVKLCVARQRPRHFDFSLSVSDTFAGWLPVFGSSDGVGLSSRFQSFPSAHTAVAVAMALGLARIYPHGRVLFAVLAVMAAGQRIESGAHFLSDTLVGAALGACVYWSCQRSALVNRWLARWERESAR